MTTRQQIEQAVSEALAAVTGRIADIEPDRLLESYGVTDEEEGSGAIEVEHWLENALQFGFRRDLTLRPDMTVAQVYSVVERCLDEDGGLEPPASTEKP